MSDHTGVDKNSDQLQAEIEANILAAVSGAKHLQDKFLVYVLAMAVEHLSECQKGRHALAPSTP